MSAWDKYFGATDDRMSFSRSATGFAVYGDMTDVLHPFRGLHLKYS